MTSLKDDLDHHKQYKRWLNLCFQGVPENNEHSDCWTFNGKILIKKLNGNVLEFKTELGFVMKVRDSVHSCSFWILTFPVCYKCFFFIKSFFLLHNF